jgi:MFS transporter, DHA1 family, tetracycline resistance protein
MRLIDRIAARARESGTLFILITIALDALAFAVIIPVVPDLVRQIGHLGRDDASFWVGVVFSAFAGAQFLFAPVLGGLSDRFGRRPVLLGSLAIMSANAIGWAFVPSLGWLVALRFVAGALSGNVAAATAYLADITPPERRGRAFGLVGAMFGLGFVVGPGLGGLLAAVSLRLPFFVAAALLACNVVYGLLVLPESLPPDRRRPFSWRRANPFGTLSLAVRDRLTRRLGLAWCCSWMALGAQQAAFILANQMRFNWSIEQNGLVLAAAGLAQALVQGVLIGRVSDRIGARNTALVGFGFAASGYGAYAAATTPALLFTGIPLLAMGALAGPSIQAMLSRAAGPTRQGEVQGTLSSLQGLSLLVAPIAMGALFQQMTHPGTVPFGPDGRFAGAPFLAASLLCLLALAVLAALPRREGEPAAVAARGASGLGAGTTMRPSRDRRAS